MNRLNYFEPFQSRAAWHEDQLTRAFLVLIRFVPLAHAQFLALVRKEQERMGCCQLLSPMNVIAQKEVRIETQTSQIQQEQGRLLSVLIADEQWTKEHEVQPSDRGARYDGILAYKDLPGNSSDVEPDWLILIENKPNEKNVWPDQINPSYHSLPAENELEIETKPIALNWRSVIRDLRGLLDRDLIGRTEKMLVQDFLDYVAQWYSYLLPFDKLEECRGNFLLQKYCDKVLHNCADKWPSHVTDEPITGGYLGIDIPGIRCLWLYPDKEELGPRHIQLALYPGDIVTQARKFFARLDIDKIQSLMYRPDWDVSPNFHFSYMATNLHRCSISLDTLKYLQFWKVNQNLIGQEKRDPQKGFLPLFERLHMDGLVKKHEFSELQEKTTKTKRAVINICPGVEITYQWSLDHAEELDRNGELEKQVFTQTSEALATFGGNL